MALGHVFIVLLVVFMWAFNVIAIKMGIAELPPLFLTLLRFVVVALLIVPFTRINREQLKTMLWLALTFGLLHFALLFVGMRFTDAGTAAVLVQLGTPFAMIIAALFLNEKLRLVQCLGIAVSLSGAVVISGSPTAASWSAVILLLISAMGWAVSNIIVKSSVNIHPVTMAGWMSFFAIPLVGLASLVFETDQIGALADASWRGWFAVFYSAIGASLVAYSLWYWLLKRYPVNQIIPFSLLSPVFAIGMGVVLMGDSLNAYKLAGAVLVIGGTFIAVVKLPSRRGMARQSPR
ncbi:MULTISPECIES: DMT family transporter [unclassified Brenneria]|uniref:DMT family transporter n=1 Tax=unclassified Brenneria TaxID=2634434 RepID=UPI001554E8A1|nr:EamA family transporter [Brenneria sp. HEZEL_4_2_4]NPC99898.1 EamA family transporter [Brenneria sp. hezel4-2-4]